MQSIQSEVDSALQQFKVLVKCVTFNHCSYIEYAMNGFCIQKTNFPFLCVIIDDCSTDGEQDILKKYFSNNFTSIDTEYTDDYFLIFGQNRINENCYFAIYFLNYNHHSIKKTKITYIKKIRANYKYYAFCEGDDYWIDENKLQKQVDFLEQNKEFGICYTKARQFLQEQGKFKRDNFGLPVEDYRDLIVNGNRIPTLSVVILRSLYDKYIDEINPSSRHWLMGDYPLWIYAFHESKGKFFDTPTCVYRILKNSASHSSDFNKYLQFQKSAHDIKMFFGKYYSVPVKPFSEKTYTISYALSSKNWKLCRTVDVSDLSLKWKIIKFVSFIPFAFVLLSLMRSVYGFFKQKISFFK